MASQKEDRQHVSSIYDDDGVELIEHAQPNLCKLVQLLANTVPELVGRAQTELQNNATLTSSTITEDKALKRENEDLRKQNEKLELTRVQQGKIESDPNIKILQAKKDELEKRLDHEIRRTSELERNYKNDIYHLQQTINKQKKEIDGLNTTAKYEIRRLKAELATKEQRDASLNMEHESYTALDLECQKLRVELNDTVAELDNTKTRLSKSMGDKLTYNNPNIADLSDENHPTQLAERFQELYDNQWADAFDLLDEINKNEDNTISALLTILKDTMLYCENEAEKQVNQMKEALTKTSAKKTKGLPQNVKKQINDMRKAVVEYSGQNIYQVYKKALHKSTSSNASNARQVPEFVEACFTVCWLMTVQDPPVVFGPHIEAGEEFNRDIYRAYTKSGSKVEFIVWPALCMYTGGAVLCKGIAQGCDKDSRRIKPAPPDSKTRHENITETNEANYAAPVTVPSHDAYVTMDVQSRSYKYDTYSRDSERNSREAEPRNETKPDTYATTVNVPSNVAYVTRDKQARDNRDEEYRRGNRDDEPRNGTTLDNSATTVKVPSNVRYVTRAEPRNENILETNPDPAAVTLPRHNPYFVRDNQARDYRNDAYSQGSGEVEHRNQADRHRLERGISYHQTTTVTKPPPTYTPKMLCQHDKYASPNPKPSPIDIELL